MSSHDLNGLNAAAEMLGAEPVARVLVGGTMVMLLSIARGVWQSEAQLSPGLREAVLAELSRVMAHAVPADVATVAEQQQIGKLLEAVFRLHFR